MMEPNKVLLTSSSKLSVALYMCILWASGTFEYPFVSHFVCLTLRNRDTVSSVGLFRSKDFPDANTAAHICFIRHALALDERRIKFIPEYVDAQDEFFSPGEYGQPRCKEVWFQGSHSDM